MPSAFYPRATNFSLSLKDSPSNVVILEDISLVLMLNSVKHFFLYKLVFNKIFNHKNAYIS